MMQENKSNKSRRSKVASLLWTVLLLSAIFVFVPSIFLQRSFADQSLYTVTQTTFINATGIGIDAEGQSKQVTIKLQVSQTVKPNGLTVLDYNATEDTGDSPFAARVGDEFLAFQAIEENQKPAVRQIIGLGTTMTLDMRYAQFGIAERYANGTAIGVNSSEYYSHFRHVDMGVSSVERTLMFDSPDNYAFEYCDANGYFFNNVINSTFEESYNIAGMNALRTNLVKTDMILYEPSDTSLNESSIHQQSLLAGGLIVVAIICIAAFFSSPYIVEGVRLVVAGGTARYQAIADAIATITAINAEKEAQLQLSRDIAAFQATLLEMVNNETITVEEAIILNNEMGYPMIAALNNRSTNINDLLSGYYSHVENQWDKYGTIFKTSWTNWLYPVIIAALVIIALLIAIKLMSRKKEPASAYPTLIVNK